MQPGVTVVLATVWLYANVVGTASLNSSRFSLDQYSPLAPQHELYQPVPIGSRRSSSTSTASPLQSFKTNYLDKDSLLSRSKGNNGDDDFSPLVEDKQRRKEFTEQKIDEGGTKDSEQPSLAQFELKDPFIADDTFQDQGPGSMEIYKLDLLRLSPLSHTPFTRYLLKGKGKTPKKTSQSDWKAKTTDYKSTSPKMFYKQSNSFDDLSTEVPPNGDPFSIGGVPELQVGCEGLAASKYKQKRSIDSGNRDKAPIGAMETWPGVTPISLDLEYDFSSVEEEEEEEVDELVRLKKLETTTKGIKQNRGDMEATRYSNSGDKRPEKLPVRGDLGKSDSQNSTGGDRKTAEEGSNFDKAKREASEEEEAKSADSLVTAHQRRRILWSDDSAADEQLQIEGRSKRQTWGFGEDEGVVSSNELQTENQRRRQDYERRGKEEERRRLEEAQRRGHVEDRTTSEVERIRQEYERSLQERTRQEEERQRRLQQKGQRTSSRWQSPEEYRRRPEELDASRRRYESPHTSTYEEERRRQEVEATRRRDLEARRRQQQELDRRHIEQRRREWMLKRRQEEEEEEKRRQQARNEPSNLLYAMRATSNVSGPYYVDPERRFREQQEREREEKLKEYMQRNRPINPVDRQREEEIKRRQDEERRRMEEERKLQEYIRRNQPVHVTTENGSSVEQRKKMDGPRVYNWSRYPGQDSGRRNHGPSAQTNIDPRSYVDERRRKEASRRTEEEKIRERERLEEEQLRKEALRREEETRRSQSRRYEEHRKRLEAARRDADRRRKELIEEQARRSQAGRTRSENTRPVYDDRARLEEQRRRQDASLIPANLVLNESRRAMEQERQRQEQERWRLEAERRRQEDSRAKQAREYEQRRRQEEARLNALPVSARIIVHPAQSSSSPRLSSRTGFDGDIDFPGVNPYRRGVEVPNFPAAATRRPPVQSPPPCVWAVVQCCPFKTNRLVTCFESMGCPGVNWDPNPCRGSITQAARQQIMKFYAESEEENRGL